MRRKAGGETAGSGYGGAAGESAVHHVGRPDRGRPDALAARGLEPRITPEPEPISTRPDDAHGALEIEFEDDDAAGPPPSPAGRSRDLRPAAITVLAAAVLGGALWGAHGAPAPAPSRSTSVQILVPPNYGAFSVIVQYRNAYVGSAAQRKIDVNLHVSPVPGAKVRIIAYYVSENGVTARAVPPPSVTPLPTTGTDVKLELTVTNCATVPIGESMGFVDVVADGPAGVIDRFTILGERYSTDLANLLRQLCPGRADGQGPETIGVVVSGS
jgi:hypothetical protein